MSTRPSMRFYFAYGSNMSRAHMARLCPRAQALGPARIQHHGFFIAAGGYGSIAPRRGTTVHGVLWRITPRDLLALDRYEEVEVRLYRHAALPVHFDDKLLRALIYVASDPRPGRASAQYRAAVIAGAREWGLSEDYILALERIMMPA